ncbi:MAG: hypothetical protein AAGF88_08185 [Pseudomonadota bacterium]
MPRHHEPHVAPVEFVRFGSLYCGGLGKVISPVACADPGPHLSTASTLHLRRGDTSHSAVLRHGSPLSMPKKAAYQSAMH